MTNNSPLGNCGNAGTLNNFYEWIANGVNEGCAWLGQSGYGTRHLYSTWRSTTTPSTTTWKAGIDGVTKVTVDIGISSAVISGAGGEISGLGNINSGHVYGCYGCNGGTPWQRATSAGGTTWFTIQSSYGRNDDGRWTIGPGTSPFTVTHPWP